MEHAKRVNPRVLAQASFDIVIRRDGTAVPVDPNRRPDGHLLHIVNSDGVFLEEFAGILRDFVKNSSVANGQGDITNIHLAEKRGWKELRYGYTYSIPLEHMARKVGNELGLTVTSNYGYKDIIYKANTNEFRAANKPSLIFNYADTEPTQVEAVVGKDLAALSKLLSPPDYRALFESRFVNWPTGNWMPADVTVEGMLRKSDFYDALSMNGHQMQQYRVLRNLSKNDMVSFIEEFAMETGSGVVVKPNVAALRAIGVYSIDYDNGKGSMTDSIASTVDALKSNPLSRSINEWLVDQTLDRDYISFGMGGKAYRAYYDIIPLIIGHGHVSTVIKYSVTAEGELLKRMPGQNPVVFALAGIENKAELNRRVAFWEKEFGMGEGRSGLVEGEEADIIKGALRDSGHIEKAAELAISAKKVLEGKLDSDLETMRSSLADIYG